MARCLIIGCGCRGRVLARELVAHGHPVRGTTRFPTLAREIEAAGAEPFVGDPDRVATIAPAFDHVSVAIVLLGSAQGTADQLAALHGPRLEMLLARLLDTTVRGVVYEASGRVAETVLRDGATRVQSLCRRSLIPCSLLDADPADVDLWLRAAREAVEEVLVAG